MRPPTSHTTHGMRIDSAGWATPAGAAAGGGPGAGAGAAALGRGSAAAHELHFFSAASFRAPQYGQSTSERFTMG